MDAKVSIKTNTKTFQNLNKNCSLCFQDKDSKLDIFWPKFICLETPQKLVNQVWSLFATLLRLVDYFDFVSAKLPCAHF